MEGREGGKEGGGEGGREVVIQTHFLNQMVEDKQNTKLDVSPWVGNVLLDREGEGRDGGKEGRKGERREGREWRGRRERGGRIHSALSLHHIND